MAGSTRVTITLPSEILHEIDLGDKNRSRFILEAVQREISRRRKLALELSLKHPHHESLSLETAGLREWFLNGKQDAANLLDLEGGMDVRWHPEQGWVEGNKLTLIEGQLPSSSLNPHEDTNSKESGRA